MLDDPDPKTMVGTVADTLRHNILPLLSGHAAFELRLCVNALELVGRELAQAEQHEHAERARLERLLGHGGTLASLNRELAGRIRDGSIALDNADLVHHLWATVMEKLAVDQPAYASYVREKSVHRNE
jgi:hypothetical protein